MNTLRTYWDNERKLRRWSSLTLAERTELVKYAKSSIILRTYYGHSFVLNIIQHLDVKESLDIIKTFLSKVSGRDVNRCSTLFEKYVELDPVGARKDLLKNKNASSKFLLGMSNISIEEEVVGLRGISMSKSIPQNVIDAQYKPTHAALLKLPPIMRLKVLDALTNLQFIKYNLFENLSEDQFNILLFPAIQKHRDEVEKVVQKYREIKYSGIQSEIKISGECENCGGFEISIKSLVVRTQNGFNKSHYGPLLANNCIFCGRYLKNNNVKTEK